MSQILKYKQNPLVNRGKHAAIVAAIEPVYSDTSRGFFEFTFKTDAGPELRFQVSNNFAPNKAIWKLIEQILDQELSETCEFDLGSLIGRPVWVVVDTIYDRDRAISSKIDKVYKRRVPQIYSKGGRL